MAIIIPQYYFNREYATRERMAQAERWFHKLSVGGQIEAIWDAYMVEQARKNFPMKAKK